MLKNLVNRKVSTTTRVLIVIDTLGGGGAEEFIYQLCRRISSDIAVLSVCALEAGGIYENKISHLGKNVYVLVLHRSRYRIFLIAFKLFKLMRTSNCDIVHIFLQRPFILATPIAWIAGKKVIHTIAGVRNQTRKWYFPMMKYFQSLISAYITSCPSELASENIRSSKIKSAEIAIDLENWLSIRHDSLCEIAPYDLRSIFPVVASIARLHPYKGHEHIIRAWPHVVKEYPDARLLIVGEGAEKENLRTLASELKVSESIIFTGYRGDLESVFSRSDIFVRTTLYEGVNLTSIQAMAAGVPVIGFSNFSPKEIICDDRNGILVPLGDVFGLAQAINRLSNDPQLRARLSKTARSRVKSYYSMDRIIAFYEQLYQYIKNNQPLNRLPDMADTIRAFHAHFSKGISEG